MPRFEIDVDPCDHITADAIGAPGQRVFYMQAFQDARLALNRLIDAYDALPDAQKAGA